MFFIINITRYLFYDIYKVRTKQKSTRHLYEQNYAYVIKSLWRRIQDIELAKYWKHRKTKSHQILYLIAKASFPKEYVQSTSLYIAVSNKATKHK